MSRREEQQRAREWAVPFRRVTQQQFLDACPPDAELGAVWLHFSVTDAVQLVDYQLMPTGMLPGPDETLNLPLVLTRAESASLHGSLPIRRPLWLQRAEAGLRQPSGLINLNLYVDPVDPYDPPKKSAPARSARECIQWLSVEAFSKRSLTHPEARSGELVARPPMGGRHAYPWLWIEVGVSMPWLCVPAQSQHLEQRWLELYARLVLGEDVDE